MSEELKAKTLNENKNWVEFCSATYPHAGAESSCTLAVGHASFHRIYARYDQKPIYFTLEQARAERVRLATEDVANKFAELGRAFAGLIVASERIEEPKR